MSPIKGTFTFISMLEQNLSNKHSYPVTPCLITNGALLIAKVPYLLNPFIAHRTSLPMLPPCAMR